jgi:segregation and condensation protein A
MERVVVKRLPQVSPEDMRNAWLGLLAKAKVTRHHKVSREQLSVREHMSRILRQLRQREFVAFAELFDVKSGIAELVVTFLAILELTKEGLVAVSQQAPFSPIYVRLAGEADA